MYSIHILVHHCYTTTALEGLEVSSLKDVVCFSTLYWMQSVFGTWSRARVCRCVASLPSYRFLKTQNTCRYYNVSPPTNPLLLTPTRLRKGNTPLKKNHSHKSIQSTHTECENTFSALRYQKINCLTLRRKANFGRCCWLLTASPSLRPCQ